MTEVREKGDLYFLSYKDNSFTRRVMKRGTTKFRHVKKFLVGNREEYYIGKVIEEKIGPGVHRGSKRKLSKEKGEKDNERNRRTPVRQLCRRRTRQHCCHAGVRLFYANANSGRNRRDAKKEVEMAKSIEIAHPTNGAVAKKRRKISKFEPTHHPEIRYDPNVYDDQMRRQ